MTIRLLPHGYTNLTSLDGRRVTKRYRGPDAEARCQCEAATLRSLGGRIPVPPVLATSDRALVLGYVDGAHGQDLIDAGRADAVLRACGRTLRAIHAIETPAAPAAGPRSVLVHGDYGPNNILFDPDTLEIAAVVDWEWSHAGDPLEDVAWCEWIVRAHHSRHVDALDDFFTAYGHRPQWRDRHEAMVARHHALIEFCRRGAPDGSGVATWRERLTRTERWTE